MAEERSRDRVRAEALWRLLDKLDEHSGEPGSWNEHEQAEIRVLLAQRFDYFSQDDGAELREPIGYCGACARLRNMKTVFAGVTTASDWSAGTPKAIKCEGCGEVYVDTAGECVAGRCKCAGQPGHAPLMRSDEYTTDGFRIDRLEVSVGKLQQSTIIEAVIHGAKCSRTGKLDTVHFCRILHYDLNDQQMPFMVLMTLRELLHHEIAEWLRHNGAVVQDPHQVRGEVRSS